MSSTACPMTPKNEFEMQLKLIRSVKTVAVVGMSPDTTRPSYDVGFYLKEKGYDIVPIHPKATLIGDLKVYPNLKEAVKVCGRIDLVDLFVAGERTRPIVEEALSLGIKKVWFQPGAEHLETEKFAREKGMEVVSGACTMAVLKRAQG